MNQTTPTDDTVARMPKQKFLYATGCFFELTKWIIVVVIFFTLIHFYVATVYIVDGISMEPNFHSGELMVANRWQYNFGKPTRGDSVVLKFPGDPEHKKYIKRIIGLPGERVTIQNGEVYINGIKLNEAYIPADVKTTSEMFKDTTLKTNEYFLMGDNRPNSNDSRVWGPAEKRYLIGRAWVELWPKIRIVHEIDY